MQRSDLVAERQRIADQLRRQSMLNNRADWWKYAEDTTYLQSILRDLDRRLYEWIDGDEEEVRLELESRRRKAEYARRERDREMARIPKLDDALAAIRAHFGRKK